MEIKLADPKRFLSEEFHLYFQILKNQETQIKALQKTSTSSPKGKARIDSLIEAKEYNLQLIAKIVAALRPQADMDYVLSIPMKSSSWRGQHNTHAYLKDFRYMRRDWCGLPDSEEQVGQIIQALRTRCTEYCPDLDSALFLGAGLARIAFEHNDLFRKVYALDKSYSMVHHFHQLLQEDIDFYEIHEFNVLKAEDSTRRLTASIQHASKEAIAHKDRFQYFIGDAMDLPFEAASLSCIASVYFTDVLALKLYFSELQRVLKPGGLFIHFGPLDYFFSDRGAMLSAEEYKDEFEANGFETLHEETMVLSHLPSELLMTKRHYTNWFFVARKKASVTPLLDHERTYKIDHPVYVQEKTQIGESEPQSIELINKNGLTFEGGGSVLALLQKIDGKTKMKDVLRGIAAEYELSEEDLSGVVAFFEQLLQQEFIQEVM
jgi:carnosine N-methyltransferase